MATGPVAALASIKHLGTKGGGGGGFFFEIQAVNFKNRRHRQNFFKIIACMIFQMPVF
ncbi:UNVERIFIED_CONTAM: potassium-transporting ATPase subunit KdpA [Campylobacter jejuni]